MEYDKNNNPIYVMKSPVNHDKKWRDDTAIEFHKKYGAWWAFQGTHTTKRVHWIERYKKRERPCRQKIN
jgi:hypothetical protein|tara:strand:- start:1391 stop:1597 length:207 start_codon:yes stop_codon:yes gene_type:complete